MAGDPRVTIVGAGLAGLSCALELAAWGVPSRLVSSQASERAQSVLAEGGINAVLDIMGEHDTLEEHFLETMRGGVWLADPNAVWGLVQDAPGIVRQLQALGVPFQREGGAMIQRNFGGQKKKRTAYVRSSTGKVLVSALIDAVRRQEARGMVERRSHSDFVELLIADGTCRGVWVRDSFSGHVEPLRGQVVLACGGMGGLFGGLTTGTTTNTGNVAARALVQGVELANLEFLQYHPTTVPIAGKRMLVSEAARGEGGRLFVERDGSPWYFMEERYPELGNLMPRDVVSREMHAVLRDPGCGNQVYLDLRGLSAGIWRNRLSDLRDEVVHYLGIDPAKTPVPVEPGIHYCMGGMLVDEWHRTSVGGLYAAGECACQYHGANRLGGNSLLGAIRGGMVAAHSVVEDEEAAGHGYSLAADATPEEEPQTSNATELAMREALVDCMGIVRSGDELDHGLARLGELPQTPRVVLAEATVRCALARQESRGAHQRADYPQMREELRKTTVVRMEDGRLAVELRPLAEAREGVPAT